MELPPLPKRHPRLSFVTGVLVCFVLLVGGSALWVLLGQQSKMEAETQRLYDVDIANADNSVRLIRTLERLAREGDAILWIDDPAERADRRRRMAGTASEATLQSSAELRATLAAAMAMLDKNLAELTEQGGRSRPVVLARWEPVMAGLLARAEAVGAEIASLPMEEADVILKGIDHTRRIILGVAAVVALATAVLAAFLFLSITRPLLRQVRLLESARDGASLVPREEYLHEMQMLNASAVALARANIELEAVRGKLEEQAHTDELTGLANRRMFDFHNRRVVEHAKRYEGRVAIILMDLDHFKKVNDQFGHEGGDVILKTVGAYLRGAVRGADLPAARIGGEEFALVLPDLSVEEACRTAERMRQEIARLECSMPSGDRIQVNVSIGVSEYLVGDAGPQQMMQRADQALYRAKNLGRNRVEIA